MPRAVALFLWAAVLPAQIFIAKPYLQLGDNPKGNNLELLWHTPDTDASWTVEVRSGAAWNATQAPQSTLIKAPGIPSHRVYHAALNMLKPGEEFAYRVSRNGAVAFESTGRARKTADQPYKFVLFGDTAEGTPGEKSVAYRTYEEKPDFVFITGDIVYIAGRISEYRDKYFPIFNADVAETSGGAPLIRSVPFIGAVGNHDTGRGNYAKFPDSMAYFLYWNQPLNGPITNPDNKSAPDLKGNDLARPDFLSAAGPRFPRMANFSFDYGNAHWLVLDSNSYVDWTDPVLRDWIKKDLASAQSATWRFVGFHHPGYNSSLRHKDDQWMRLVSNLFEAGNVDVVFAGHVHNYQRTYPLTFKPTRMEVEKNGDVPGEWSLDKDFGNGSKNRPKGVVYIVSGGGGATLYDPELQKTPAKWLPFTTTFISEVHSYTVAEVNGKTLKVKQVSEKGDQVDAWQIAK